MVRYHHEEVGNAGLSGSDLDREDDSYSSGEENRERGKAYYVSSTSGQSGSLLEKLVFGALVGGAVAAGAVIYYFSN